MIQKISVILFASGIFLIFSVFFQECRKEEKGIEEEALLMALLLQPAPAPLATVDSVDATRYAGKWYEIASLPQVFQKDCTCVSANYTILTADTIRVENRCNKGSVDGPVSSIEGKAYVVPDSGNAKLLVEFFFPFKSDYWILDLDRENYSYAMVGDPTRNSLWILSRSRTLDSGIKANLLDRARSSGFDTDRVKDMVQNGCSDG